MIIRTRTHGKSSTPRVRGTSYPVVLAAFGLWAILAGCSAPADTAPSGDQAERWDAQIEPTQDKPDTLREQARAVLGNPTDENGIGARSGGAAEVSKWTIILTKIDVSRPELVDQTLASLGKVFPGVRLTQREGGNFLTLGQYNDPRTPQARADLRRVHAYEIKLGDRTARPYAEAFIAAPTAQSLQGTNATYDLRNVHTRFGDKAIYTLQVAIYGRNDRNVPSSEDIASFRRAAEEAVVSLRRGGEQAFYYHGPSRSTVTIGVFYEEDHDPTTLPRIESERLKAAREQHPLNLLNGQGITQVLTDERGQKIRKPQPSFLVGIPKE